MTTEPEYVFPQFPDRAQSMIAVIKSATFSSPLPDDRVHLSTHFQSGNITNQEFSYAQYEQHIADFQGALIVLPHDESSPLFQQSMTRAQYVDILIADNRPEDAEELKRLILEEIDEVLGTHKSQEEFAQRFRERQYAIDQAREGRTE